MLKGINRQSIFYDLVGLSHNGAVAIGRESDAVIRLDCPEVPFLLSRKHATVRVQPDGSLALKDLRSTNGTYVAREGDFLRRMREDEVWELKRGDTVGFGGPETIVARSETPDETVANPFLFKYVPMADDEHDSTYHSTAIKLSPAPASQGRARKFSEINQPQSHHHDAMDCEEAPSSPQDKENKKAKTISAKDIAALLSNHLTCAICHDWLAGAHALSCGHMFCGLCLASWLTHKPSCPECRKPTAGVPVRCRNIDNTIGDLLSNNLASPNSKRERRRKQQFWEEVGDGVAEEWAQALARRRQQAHNSAQQHLASLTGQPQQPALVAAGAPLAAAAAPVAAPPQGARVQAGGVPGGNGYSTRRAAANAAGRR